MSDTPVINVVHIEGTALYLHLRGQTGPQPAHVCLDCRTGRLTAEADPHIGASPADAYNGHIQRWIIPTLREGPANSLLDEIAPIAARVVAGYSVEFQHGNKVARFAADAEAAIEEIRALCDEAGEDSSGKVSVWKASEWFAPLGGTATQASELGITASTTDEELTALAVREKDQYLGSEVDDIEGLDDYLTALRDGLREAA